MAEFQSIPDDQPGNLKGVVDLEIDVLDVEPDYDSNAVRVTVLNPAGDGVVLLLDAPLVFDTALRLIGSYMRLRGMTP
jgi:hypothetical protein